MPGGRHERLADAPAVLGADRDVVQVRPVGGQPSGARDGLVERGVDAPVGRDLGEQPLAVGRAELLDLAVAQQRLDDRVRVAQLLEGRGVGRVAGLRLALRGELELVVEDVRSWVDELTLNSSPASAWIVASSVAASRGQLGVDPAQALDVDADPGDLHPGEHPDEWALDLLVEAATRRPRRARRAGASPAARRARPAGRSPRLEAARRLLGPAEVETELVRPAGAGAPRHPPPLGELVETRLAVARGRGGRRRRRCRSRAPSRRCRGAGTPASAPSPGARRAGGAGGRPDAAEDRRERRDELVRRQALPRPRRRRRPPPAARTPALRSPSAPASPPRSPRGRPPAVRAASSTAASAPAAAVAVSGDVTSRTDTGADSLATGAAPNPAASSTAKSRSRGVRISRKLKSRSRASRSGSPQFEGGERDSEGDVAHERRQPQVRPHLLLVDDERFAQFRRALARWA